MRSPLLAALPFLLLNLACQQSATKSSAPPTTSQTATPVAKPQTATQHGAPISNAPVVDLANLITTPLSFEGQKVIVNGTVRATCQNKGCWMELATGTEEKAPGCRVTFKDYGFFVPRDSAGATARVEAVVKLDTVSKEMVEHWESEGATFALKNPDGTAREIHLVATGVELQR